MGASPELLAHLQGQADACEVWADNWDTVRVFCSLGTQWRVAAGMAGLVWLGLDYATIPPVLRLMAIPRRDWPELFEGLRVMERSAAEVRNQSKG